MRHTRSEAITRQLEYWRFYWPLALTGAVGVLAVQFQNGTLARYPDAATELAVLALALSVYGLFNAALSFVPQLVTVFARSVASRRTTFRFVLLLSGVFAAIVEGVGVTELGARALQLAFGIDAVLLARVLAYLCLLAPLLVLDGLRMCFIGLLVQQRLTGRVTLLNALYLTSVASALVLGFRAELDSTLTLIYAQALGTLVHCVVGGRLALAHHRVPDAEADPPDFARLARFFVPVATTGVMFAISRPVLYAFVARTPEGVVSIAALRIAFDFTFFFQQASNQFRHFFVTFGLDDLPAKRLFMSWVTAGITLAMLLVALTPLGELFLHRVLGVSGAIEARALDVILVMTLLPVIIIVRNYYHGILMVTERTGGMATGSILRVLLISALAAALAVPGALDHVAAAWVLLAGFAVETLIVWWRAVGPGAPPMAASKTQRDRTP